MMTVRAHFDGHHVQLDEPVHLKPDTKVLVVVPEKESLESERRDLEALSLANLADFYDDEPDIYTDAMIIRQNPGYREAR